MLQLDERTRPDERLELVWSHYERETGISICRPPSGPERIAVRDYLRRIDQVEPMVLARKSARVRWLVTGTLSEKAWLMAQAACNTCETILQRDGTVEMQQTFVVDVDPWSAQSAPNRVAIRDAVRAELFRRGIPTARPGAALCATVVALTSRRTSVKDVDNLIKGLLDGMQGPVYPNDRQLQCVTSRRIGYSGNVGHYIVSIRSVWPWPSDVVYDDPTAPLIAAGERITVGPPLT